VSGAKHTSWGTWLTVVCALWAVSILGHRIGLSVLEGRVCCVNYWRIYAGMDLKEVETFLGCGRELTKDTVPLTTDFTERVPERRLKPVVIGDRIFVWEDDQTEIYVGFRHNKVCSKWFWRMGL
jgi:hypothetical protein